MATILDQWRVLPRLMMMVQTVVYIRCIEWALSQPDLSTSQAGLISVVTGRWHTEERGWSDIGYHFVIHRNGQIAAGRPITRSGAHTRGRNKSTIGIALVGGRGGCANDAFLDNFTADQERELRALVESLQQEFPDIEHVTGHNNYAPKACPCFDVKKWLRG